jgi:ketosteroid isomerase-like protein
MSRDLFPVVPAIAAAMVLAAPAMAAQTSGPNAEIAAVIDATTSAWTGGDIFKMRAQYAPDCVFTDEFEPFFWSGPGALYAYLMSGGRNYRQTQHVAGKAVFGPPRYIYVSGDRAFVVEPVSGSDTVRGKPYASEGAFAFSLRRIDGRWKITSQTWTKASETLNPY